MNYGISILFRAIPLAMAVFCFGYGAFIYGYGDVETVWWQVLLYFH